MLYGDGELHVLAVPRPESLAELGASDSFMGNGGEDGEASDSSRQRIYIRLRPKAAAPADALDSSLGSCVEWLQVPPHDLLLVRVHPSRESRKAIEALLDILLLKVATWSQLAL